MIESNINIQHMLLEVEQFIQEIKTSIESKTFIKILLSKYKGIDNQIIKLTIKPVYIRGHMSMTFITSYKNSRVTSLNYSTIEIFQILTKIIGTEYFAISLFTNNNNVKLIFNNKNKPRILYEKLKISKDILHKKHELNEEYANTHNLITIKDYPYTWEEIRKKFIIYEDNSIIAINKPYGLTVSGDRNNIDIVTIANKSGVNLIPVHRIDKETSGLIVFAKNSTVHAEITRQFYERSVDKFYLAIVIPTIANKNEINNKGIIDLPLSIGRKNKVRIASDRVNIFHDYESNSWSIPHHLIFPNIRNYPSITQFNRLINNNNKELFLVKPITGRKNQIRVHLAWIGYPIDGDPLFKKSKDYSRTFLHSWKIKFKASWIKESIDGINESFLELEAPVDIEFLNNIQDNLNYEQLNILTNKALEAF